MPSGKLPYDESLPTQNEEEISKSFHDVRPSFHEQPGTEVGRRFILTTESIIGFLFSIKWFIIFF